MKSYAIVLSAVLLSACAAEPGTIQNGAKPRLSAAERDQCQREATQMYPVALDMNAQTSGPSGQPAGDIPAAYGPHPSATDKNADLRSKMVAECYRDKESKKQ